VENMTEIEKLEVEIKTLQDKLVILKQVEKFKAQKLWYIMRDKLGFSIDMCDEIVDAVEEWLPEQQSAAGSQNVDTELLVDGFNDCLRKMKEMLR
jgi:protein-tyrosine phosphatase